MLLSEDNYVLVVREYDENNADQAAELFGKVINNKYQKIPDENIFDRKAKFPIAICILTMI